AHCYCYVMTLSMYSLTLLVFLFFFFSSRRRHTRFSRDWSSDVCSSDLGPTPSTSVVLNTMEKDSTMSSDPLTSQDVNLAPRPTFSFSGRARTPSSLGKRPRTDEGEKPQSGMLAIMESMSAQNGQLLKTVADLTV